MRILYLEDHLFFARGILEYLERDLHADITYVKSWKEVKAVLDSGESFDFSLLDVLLQNGKTGVHVAEASEWKKQLGNILFITGCTDDITLQAIKNFCSVSKMKSPLPNIVRFILTNEEVHINEDIHDAILVKDYI